MPVGHWVGLHMRAFGVLCSVLVGLLPATSHRVVLTGEGETPSFEVHGFVSQGFILTRETNFLAKSAGGSFEFSEAGINFTVQLTDQLRSGFQIFAHQL